MPEALLIGSIFLVCFAYFGYPLTLVVACWLGGRDITRAAILPSVTFIVTVHNEEARIKEKLENTLSLDYPRDRLSVLVASDGSTDATNVIVRGYLALGVKLLEIPGRQGKEYAQREAVRISAGDILVFSDVATALELGGLKQLVSSFADPTVGCVSSVDRLVGRGGRTSGEGWYLRYEMWLRDLESRAGSLVGLSGSLFAARKEVCEDFSGEMQSDFRTVLNSIAMGLRGVSDPLAFGLYHDTADHKREWSRKIRTVVRGLTVFFRHVQFLNVLKYGFFSYQLFCHKLLRWLVPFFLIVLFIANVALIHRSAFYDILMLLQLLMYGCGTLGILTPSLQSVALFRIPSYFLTVNASILFAWWRYCSGQRIVTWTPTRR